MSARQHASLRSSKAPAIALALSLALPAMLCGCFHAPGPVATLERVVDGRRLNADIRPMGRPELMGEPTWESPGALEVRAHRRQAGTCDQEKLRQQVQVLREQRIYFRKTFEDGPLLAGLDFVLEALATIGSFGFYDVYKVTKLLEDKAEDDAAAKDYWGAQWQGSAEELAATG